MKMENNNMYIVNDLKSLINNYISDDQVKEFFKSLDDDITLNTQKDSLISEPDKSQVEYQLPKGIKYRQLVDKALTHCEKLLPDDKYFKLLLDLSQLMLFAGEVPFSLELAENLLIKLNHLNKYDAITAETNLMISKIYWAQAYWDESLQYISEAMNIFQSLESKTGIAKCENMLGTVYGEKGEFDRAQKHFVNALIYLKEEDDVLSHAMVLTNLGIINTIQGDFEKAIWNYKNSVERYVMLKDTRRLSRTYHNIGMLYTRMEKYDSALDEFNKCITLSLENDYLSNCAVAYIGKAFIYTKLKNAALADAYTNKAMEIAYKINDTLSIADIYKIKGMIHNDLENFSLSEEFFEDSIRLNKDIDSKLNEAESSAEMSKLLHSSKRDEEAEKYTSVADAFFNDLKNSGNSSR
jgi:tetratricopeptide (TPR) repeat protein